MPAKNAMTDSEGFNAEERAAMKDAPPSCAPRARQAPRRPGGLQAVLDRIAEMTPEDRALA